MTTPLFPDVVVNGEHLPPALIAAEAQHHTAPRGKPGLAWRKAARAVAIRALLLQEARRRGLAPEPAKIGPGRRETADEALIRALLDDELRPAPPAAADVRAEYDRDPDRFRSPPLWEASHILIACDDAGADAALLRAQDVARRALAAPGDFAALARRESDCGSAASGGVLGQLGPGDTVPAFEAALRGLDQGQITADPVRSPHGWHVIRMDACAPGQVLPFQAVRDKIALAMEKADWSRQARALTARLVADAQVSGVDMAVGA